MDGCINTTINEELQIFREKESKESTEKQQWSERCEIEC